jgi:membrane-bound lytic murein transglycosylase A
VEDHPPPPPPPAGRAAAWDLARALRRWQRLALGAALLALGASSLAVYLALGPRIFPPPSPPAPAPPPAAEPLPDRLDLRPATFADLPGWLADRPAEALPAILRSCRALAGLPAEGSLGPGDVGGTAGDWRAVCAAAATLPAGDDAAARAFLEARFVPWAATNRGEPRGLFTGYYEPTLRGSRRRGGRFTVPLYLRPPELVTVDLGRFRPELAGRRIAGRVEGGSLRPYADRAAIDAGALAGRGLELLWVDDPIDAFFLHIQGSGRIELAEGGALRVGYAAGNGHVYFAIGRELVDRGALAQEEVSMQAIRRWLRDHPAEAGAVMARNPSFVFFRRLDGEGPVGAQAVVLTPGRSLAVDGAFLPLGAPAWVETLAPHPDPAQPDVRLRRLMVIQDAGGGLQGPVRGDLFWGAGEEAAEIAGRMRHPGRLWLLLPRIRSSSARSPSRAP